jgi:hypothetical protein
MISGLGYQALGPLCVLAPDHCGATFAGLAHGFPAARGPPLPFRRIASGPIRSPSCSQLLPDKTLGQAVGPR